MLFLGRGIWMRVGLTRSRLEWERVMVRVVVWECVGGCCV